MIFKKLLRVAALLLVAATLLSLVGCSASRKARPNGRADKVVATAGEWEITYDSLYYVTMTRIAELKRHYGEDALSDPSRREDLKTFVKANLFTRFEALLMLGESYGIDVEKGEIADLVQADMDAILANELTFNGDRKAYIDSLNKEYLTDRYVRTYLAAQNYLSAEVIDKMLRQGDLDDSDETARDLINGADFIRTVHVFVSKVDGLYTAEEDAAHAAEVQAKIAALTDPDARYDAMHKAIGGKYNNDMSDLTGNGHYFAKGEMEAVYEAAAFALAPYEVSPVVETTEGYYIIMQLPKDAGYIEENFQALKEKSYYAALNQKLQKTIDETPVTLTKYGEKLDLTRLPPIDADGGEVPFIIAIVLVCLIVGGGAAVGICLLLKKRGKIGRRTGKKAR